MLHSMKYAALLAAAVAMPASAAVTLTTLSYTQDFDSLVSIGTSGILPMGWLLAEAGANANTTYAAGNGSNNAGNTYSYGATGAFERALGGLASGTLTPRYGVEFVNNLGAVITALDISYSGELWRAGFSGSLNTLSFSYSVNATSLTSGSYTNFTALDYSITPGGTSNEARNGNSNRTAIAASITGLNIANGGRFFLRWTGDNAPGNDHGLAIDDFRLSATAVPEPASWAMLITGFGLVGATMRRRRTVAA